MCLANPGFDLKILHINAHHLEMLQNDYFWKRLGISHPILLKFRYRCCIETFLFFVTPPFLIKLILLVG